MATRELHAESRHAEEKLGVVVRASEATLREVEPVIDLLSTHVDLVELVGRMEVCSLGPSCDLWVNGVVVFGGVWWQEGVMRVISAMPRLLSGVAMS